MGCRAFTQDVAVAFQPVSRYGRPMPGAVLRRFWPLGALYARARGHWLRRVRASRSLLGGTVAGLLAWLTAWPSEFGLGRSLAALFLAAVA
ncbi:MAG: hypothetical protein ACLUE1_01605 [Adlercreutzia equolifaciens]